MSQLDPHVRRLIDTHIGALSWKQGKARAQQLVADTKELDREQTRLQWAWADLSLELVPVGVAGGDHSLQGVLLQAFLDDFEVPWTKATLHTLRQTAAAWPKSRRKKTSFAVHKILKPHTDRYRLIRNDMTVAEALSIMGRKAPEAHSLRQSPVETMAALRSWIRVFDRRTVDELGLDTDLHHASVETLVEFMAVAVRLGFYDDAVERMGERDLVGVA